MKRTVVKKFVGFGVALLMAGVISLSCSHETGSYEIGAGDDSGDSSEGASVSSKVRFDFSGAKAIAQLEGSTGSARAAATDISENFVKILADGSMESFISIDGSVDSLANIESVYRSPAGDVFIVFGGVSVLEDQWEAVGNHKSSSMGGLICIYPDGTVIDILKVRDTEDVYRNYYGCQSC